MSDRIQWIDNAKAIGAILVICLHIPNSDVCIRVISSFVLPLFFFLSGFNYKVEKKKTRQYVFRKYCSLVWPSFVVCGIVGTCIEFIYSRIMEIPYNIEYKRIVIGTLLQMRGSYEFGAWFLICLFVSQLITLIITKYVIKKDYQICIIYSVIFYIMGCIYSIFIKKVMPWSLDVSLFGVAYILLGYYVKKSNTISTIANGKYIIFYIVMFCVGNAVLFQKDKRIDMYLNEIGHPIAGVLTVLGGIGIIVVISKYILNNRLLSMIGQNSMLIYCLQYAPIYILNHIIGKEYNIVSFLVYLILTVSITLIMSLFIRKYFARYIGISK